MSTVRLLRVRDLRKKLGIGDTTIYRHINEKCLTPPIKMGDRCSVFPEDEIDAIVQARIAGKSDDEIRRLVAKLVAARTQAA